MDEPKTVRQQKGCEKAHERECALWAQLAAIELRAQVARTRRRFIAFDLIHGHSFSAVLTPEGPDRGLYQADDQPRPVHAGAGYGCGPIRGQGTGLVHTLGPSLAASAWPRVPPAGRTGLVPSLMNQRWPLKCWCCPDQTRGVGNRSGAVTATRAGAADVIPGGAGENGLPICD